MAKSGPGTWTIIGAAHDYTGTTTLGGGVLDIGPVNSGSLGAGGLVFSGGVLQGNGTFSRTLSGNSTPGPGQVSGAAGGFAAMGGPLTVDLGPLVSLNAGSFRFGTNFIFGSAIADCPVNLTTDIDFGGGNRNITVNAGTGGDFAEISAAANQALTVSGIISGTAGAAVNKTGEGVVVLASANTYTTPTVIAGGVLIATTLSDAGLPGSLGAASDVSGNLVINGDTLRHDRSNMAATNRKFSIGLDGGTINSSAASPADIVQFSTPLAMGFNSQLGPRSLTLTGSNPGDNIMNLDVKNDGSNNPTGLIKDGAGKWLLTGGSNEYTGDTTVNAGTLVLADNAGLKFLVTDSTSNAITGSVTVILNGDFTIDTTAVTATAGSWPLVDTATLTETFGGTFTVVGWAETANVWTKVDGARTWSFSETTGLPSLAGTGWEYHTFKLDASEGLAGKGFLRLKVVQP